MGTSVAILTAAVSAFTALMTVVLTSFLSRRREHEADWRRMKLERYQAFVLAVSGIVEGRVTNDSMREYTDAYNSMSLIASMRVLRPLKEFQDEISVRNVNRSRAEHDRLFDRLIRELRRDLQPSDPASGSSGTLDL